MRISLRFVDGGGDWTDSLLIPCTLSGPCLKSPVLGGHVRRAPQTLLRKWKKIQPTWVVSGYTRPLTAREWFRRLTRNRKIRSELLMMHSLSSVCFRLVSYSLSQMSSRQNFQQIFFYGILMRNRKLRGYSMSLFSRIYVTRRSVSNIWPIIILRARFDQE